MDFDNKQRSLSRKITSNKAKHLLVENQFEKKKKKRREEFDSIYFRTKSHFEDDGTQNYLLYQPIQRYFKRIDGFDDDNYRNYIYYWKSKGFSDEKN